MDWIIHFIFTWIALKAWHLFKPPTCTSSVKVSSMDKFTFSLPLSHMVTLTQLSSTCRLFSPDLLNVICSNGLLFPLILTRENDFTGSFLKVLFASSLLNESMILETPLLTISSFLWEAIVESSVISCMRCWNSFRIRSRMKSSMPSVSVHWSVFGLILSSVILEEKKKL